eukprot:TRINITY_DN21764_c0_g1_i2.p1 TRINITY_DN21764_c0_g1~~TRINITY_DN21764_c0_g1_i2.p1  ORF type:complete len:629 (+),score=124.38 TRINITY_DN21764_c0_g1_i2:203-2089(+)
MLETKTAGPAFAFRTDPDLGQLIRLLDWKAGRHQNYLAVFVEDWDSTSEERHRILGQPVAVTQEVLAGKAQAQAASPALDAQACQGAATARASFAPGTGQVESQVPRSQRQGLTQVVDPPSAPVPVATPARMGMRSCKSDQDPVCVSPRRATSSLARSAPPTLAAPESLAQLPLVPIAQLSSFTPRCKVRARVVSKSGIREFRNSRGPGKLFSIDVMDAAGACTRVTFFGTSVDKFYNMVSMKGVYEIANAIVKPANPRFCKYSMELTLDERLSTLTAIAEDGSIPQMPYHFVQLAQLSSAPVNSHVDVAGVAIRVDEPVSVSTRNGPRMKRQAVILDDSNASVALTMWAEKVEVTFGVGSVLFVRGAKVSDYHGCTLDLNENSFAEVDPDDPRAFRLQAWYLGGGKDEPVRLELSNSQRGGSGRKRSLAEVRIEDAALQLQAGGPGAQSDPKKRSVNYHRVSPAAVIAVPHDRPPFYYGCTAEVPGFGPGNPPRQCNRKVENGCCSAGHTCPTPTPRYSLFLKVADATTLVSCRAFGEEAERIAGISAAELAQLDGRRLAGDIQAGSTYEAVFRKMAAQRWSMILKSKKDAWEGKERVDISVNQCSPIDFVTEGMSMAAEVRQAIST